LNATTSRAHGHFIFSHEGERRPRAYADVGQPDANQRQAESEQPRRMAQQVASVVGVLDGVGRHDATPR